MKKHAIIPIFIPHEGCPNDCVFCNQRKITARQNAATCEQVRTTIKQHLQTLKSMNLDIIEVAFYGGSFTGIPISKQSEYLAIAKEYKDCGLIDKIHLSTRPDYISKEILDNLKRYNVDIIELGVQSFDEEVLKMSNRGHNVDCVYRASTLIKEYGFQLGIQLMTGLPGDTKEKCIYSAKEAVKLKPEIARLYPTVVIDNTELCEMCKKGTYIPLSINEAVNRTKAMYEILAEAGINIIRVGLKSSDIIMNKNSMSSKTFHPAFRQLVESEIAREKIEKKLELLKYIENAQVTIYTNSHSISNAVGLNGSNRKAWGKMFPNSSFNFKVNNKLKNYEYEVGLNLETTITDSSGNITAYIHNPVKQAGYSKIANELLALSSYGIEQVAFIKEGSSSDWDGEIEMAGLEFCGNATRSFGLMIAQEKSIKNDIVRVKTSGTKQIINIAVNTDCNTAKVEMPRPNKIFTPEIIASIDDSELETILEHSTFVDFKGIFHVVCLDLNYTESGSRQVFKYIKTKYNPSAIGIMYYNQKESYLIPVVQVVDMNTTKKEGSCCSGTTALSYVLAQNLTNGEHVYHVKQPGGILTSRIIKDKDNISVFIDSPIKIYQKTNIEIL